MKFKINPHETFVEFFNEENLKLLENISSSINNYTPNSELVLRFCELDLAKIKVIWLGQDPYFQKGVATGRSFEASNVVSWDDKFKQVSLKNIIRGIYKAYYPNEFSVINTYSNIMIERRFNNFKLLDPKEWFNSLEDQGVMFLNTYFTCEIDKPNSHRKVWETFSKRLFEYIYYKNPNIIWFLWGNEAKSVLEVVPNIKHYKSNHPMMCNVNKPEDFLNNNCFKDTKNIINWLGTLND